MSMSDTASELATDGTANASAALIIGTYLAIVIWRGNIGALANAAREDFLGTDKRPAFWRWAMAVLILVILADVRATKPFFGYTLAIALAGMFVNMATAHPDNLKNLMDSLRALYGVQSSTTADTTGTLKG